MKAITPIVLALALAGGTAVAQTVPSTAPPPAGQAAPGAALQVHRENGFSYVCGGVGESETEQIKRQASRYDMMLTFATRTGAYLANVNVDIRNTQGDTQLKTICDAPIMLVDFPKSGTYQIHAETGGFTLNRTAHVQANERGVNRLGVKAPGAKALVMLWPSQIGESVTPATSTGDSGERGQSESGMPGEPAPNGHRHHDRD